MMYDFGTGVEELAYAAQSFGYRGSYAFHDASLADLAGQLASGSPVPGPMLPADRVVTVPANDLNSLPIGTRGDGQSVLLWTADDRGVNFVPEQTSWPTSRVSRLNPDTTIVPHTNLSRGAFAGGEAWRTGPGQITITPASGAYGYNAGLAEPLLEEAGLRYDAAVEFLRDLGVDVTALPFGPR